MTRFGDNLLRLMEEEDISVRSLSLMTGIKIGKIQDLLAGIKEADYGTMIKLAEALGVDERELIRKERISAGTDSCASPDREIPGRLMDSIMESRVMGQVFA